MIQSKYISDIVDLLLDGDSDGLAARPQIPFLTDIEYEYMGAALFVTFSHSDEINEFKLGKDTSIINGVEIKSSELEIGAEALWLLKMDSFITWKFSRMTEVIQKRILLITL